MFYLQNSNFYTILKKGYISIFYEILRLTPRKNFNTFITKIYSECESVFTLILASLYSNISLSQTKKSIKIVFLIVFCLHRVGSKRQFFPKNSSFLPFFEFRKRLMYAHEMTSNTTFFCFIVFVYFRASFCTY